MINAECHRNLQLEFTPVKLVMSPAIVMVVTLILYLASKTRDHFFEFLLFVSGGMAGFALLVWAMKQAADSVFVEVNNRTWIFQRMSSISAVDMTLGKLFGSTAYAWYSAGCCLLMYVISAFNCDNTLLRLKVGLLLILAGITIHALVLLVSLLIIRNARFTGGPPKNQVFLLGMGLVFFMVLSLVRLDPDYPIHWYGRSLCVMDFYLLTLVYTVVWGIIGLVRMMRAELQYDNTPLVWCIFVVTLFLYCDGFVVKGSAAAGVIGGNAHLLLGGVLLSVLTYFTMMMGPFDPVLLRKMADRVRQWKWREAAYALPLWLPTLAAAFLVAAALLLHDWAVAPTVLRRGGVGDPRQYVLTYLPLTVLLFIVRDIGVVGLIRSAAVKRGDIYVGVYLALAYGLLPIIFLQADLGVGLYAFWPVPTGGPGWQLTPAALQAAGVIALMWRHRRVFSPGSAIMQPKR